MDDSLPSRSYFVPTEATSSIRAVKKKAQVRAGGNSSGNANGNANGRSSLNEHSHSSGASMFSPRDKDRDRDRDRGLAFTVGAGGAGDWGDSEPYVRPAPMKRTPRKEPSAFLRRGSRVEPSFLNRLDKHMDPAALLSGPDAIPKHLLRDKSRRAHKGSLGLGASASSVGAMASRPRRDIPIEVVVSRPYFAARVNEEEEVEEVEEEEEEEEDDEDGFGGGEGEGEEIILSAEDGYWGMGSEVAVGAGLEDTAAFAATERGLVLAMDSFADPELTLGPREPSSLDGVAMGTLRLDDSCSWGAVSGPSFAASRPRDGRGQTVSRPRVDAEEVGLVGTRPRQPRDAESSKARAGVEGDRVSAELVAKARELETELARYREETAGLRRQRRQQESLLADLVQQRAEAARWVAEERARTEAWCEEQRQAATRERRAAAKQAKEARDRLSSGLPSRRERAEIEALHATIEKLRAEGEAAQRKAKAAERRLMQSLKDAGVASEEQTQLVLRLESDKMELLGVLAGVDVLPSVRNKRLAGELARAAAEQRLRLGADSYAEEVAVEEDPPSTAHGEGALSLGVRSSHTWGKGAATRYSSESEGGMYESRSGVGGGGAYESRSFAVVGEGGAPLSTLGKSAVARSGGSALDLGIGAEGRGAGSSVDLGKSADKTEEVGPDGTRYTRYRNGTVKEARPDGSSWVRFANGDTKRSEGGVTTYVYAEAQTTHTTYPNGVERYEFPNQQTENHYPDGRKEILFPDGTRKVVHADGLQESVFADGVVVREYAGGLREVVTADGVVHRDFGESTPSL